MKILKDAAKFKVLSKTNNVIKTIATAARVCYQTQDRASPEADEKLVKSIIDRQHGTMLEFADMTVRFDNTSRGDSHELVRHRVASYAQESSRRVDTSDFLVVVPPKQDETHPIIELKTGTGDSIIISLEEWFAMNEQAYRGLRSAGWPAEDARQLLPTAIKSQIVVKTNMREWRHIFSMRCDSSAHWEIRSVMCKLLKHCRKHIPIIFDDFHFFQSEKFGEYARIILSPRVLGGYIEDYLRVDNSILDLVKNSQKLKELIDCLV
jgi:thymidylate synthase (FAD)